MSVLSIVPGHPLGSQLQPDPQSGYCSSKFDDVANGKSLVQGQLVINFVSPGYLIGALNGTDLLHTGSRRQQLTSIVVVTCLLQKCVTESVCTRVFSLSAT